MTTLHEYLPEDVVQSTFNEGYQRSANGILSSAVNEFGDDVSPEYRQMTYDVGRGILDSAVLGGPGGGLFGGNGGLSSLLGGDRTWQSSKYAADMIPLAPKHRFIFKVQFVFNAEYQTSNREFTYVVRNIDKPKVQFEYEEVNMYNYWTKVLRTIKHEPLSMVFHDDIQNKVLQFFNEYREAYSPISNLTINEAPLFETSGMDFTNPNGPSRSSAASGVLRGDNKNVLSYIRLYQIYGHGTRENIFTFINPKIDHFDFDNVDHENTDGNALAVTFTYDSLHVQDGSTGSGIPMGDFWGSDILGGAASSIKRTVDGIINTHEPSKNVVKMFEGNSNPLNDVGAKVKDGYVYVPYQRAEGPPTEALFQTESVANEVNRTLMEDVYSEPVTLEDIDILAYNEPIKKDPIGDWSGTSYVNAPKDHSGDLLFGPYRPANGNWNSNPGDGTTEWVLDPNLENDYNAWKDNSGEYDG